MQAGQLHAKNGGHSCSANQGTLQKVAGATALPGRHAKEVSSTFEVYASVARLETWGRSSVIVEGPTVNSCVAANSTEGI